MHRLWDELIGPLVEATAPKVAVEIGGGDGRLTAKLLAYCGKADALLHVICADPQFDIAAVSDRWEDRLVLHRDLSLNALPRIDAPDFVLIAGDSNYFMVRNELELIHRHSVGRNGAFPLVLLHNVGWPYGRRDVYADPDAIPDAFRYPYRKAGLIPGQTELAADGGLNAHLNNSIYETPLRSGVLTAVEDFIGEKGKDFLFAETPAFHGLGLLWRADGSARAETAGAHAQAWRAGEAAEKVLAAVERERIAAIIAKQRNDISVQRAEADAEAAHQRAAEHEQALAAAQGELREARGEIERLTAELVIARAMQTKEKTRTASSPKSEKASKHSSAETAPISVAVNAAAPQLELSAPAPMDAAVGVQPPALGGLRARLQRPAALARSAARLAWWTVTLRLPQRLAERRERNEKLAQLHRSGLFDPKWYKQRYRDVAAAGIDPALHFLNFGLRDMRDPGPYFSSKFYLSSYPDVAKSGVNPLLDYLNGGAEKGRNPSPDFESEFYLAAYPDVAAKKINPLVHYVKFGKAEGRKARRPPSLLAKAPSRPAGSGALRAAPLPTKPRHLSKHDKLRADIIVPIHNSAADVALCLDALARHRRPHDRVILIDDGSEAETRDLAARFASAHPSDILLRNEEAQGYTRAVNRGLDAANADYVILLNSDTIVTPDWTAKLIAAGESAPAMGIVGPLSNAASWQSVPERFRPDGDWAVNGLQAGLDPLLMGRLIEAVSPAERNAEAALVNGFCFAIKRAVIAAIGKLDEESFPQGYGEETDYCFRAIDAGFDCGLAFDAYVHHAKSRSFTHERRRTLSKAGNETLRLKYGLERISAATNSLRSHAGLEGMRQRVAHVLMALREERQPSILFLLPCQPGGGGVHSIVQEAYGLTQLGARVSIAVPAGFLKSYEKQYAPPLTDAFITYESEGGLIDLAGSYEVCVATINGSIALLEQICNRHARIIPCYYAQDYEPLFYDEGSDRHRAALNSYAWISHAIVFAKTNWIRDTIEARHGVRVSRVQASLDKALYHAGEASPPGPVRVCAMVRPSTPRRGPERTLRVLQRLQERHGGAIEARIFGAEPAEFATAGIDPPSSIANAGRLLRKDVAEELRRSDVFLDLSDYQAFGRTALEAMACGAAVVVPTEGGAGEFARDGDNCLYVDTKDEQACFEAASRLVTDEGLRARLRTAGLKTAESYSIDGAARSELILFRAALALAAEAPALSAAAE